MNGEPEMKVNFNFNYPHSLWIKIRLLVMNLNRIVFMLIFLLFDDGVNQKVEWN